MADVPISVLQKLITPFSGDKHNLHEFLDNCNTAYKLASKDNKINLFEIIKCNVKGNAGQLVRNRTFTDWPDLENFLTELYSDKRSMGQYQLALNTARQGTNESVSEFSIRIEQILLKMINSLDSSLNKADRAANTKLLREQALHAFLVGLNQKFSIIVKSQKPTSLEDAFGYAQAEEMELNSRIDISRYKAPQNCSFCNLTNHTVETCFRKNKKLSKFGQPQNVASEIKQCTFCNIFGHTEHECRKKQNQERKNHYVSLNQINQAEKICRYCKKPGHLLENCYAKQNADKNKNKTCSYCKKRGHSIDRCFQKNDSPDQKTLNCLSAPSTAQTWDLTPIRAEYSS